MKQKLITKWVKALRSGKFKQIGGVLEREYANGDTRNCCLGVLCRIEKVRRHLDSTNTVMFDDNDEVLSSKLLKRFGLSLEEQGILTEMNDEEISFKEIAAGAVLL